MSESVKFLDSEIYPLVFFSLLVLLLLCESFRPRRAEKIPPAGRWGINFSLFILNILLVYGVFPIGAVAMAVYAETSGVGLFQWLHSPLLIASIVGIGVMDLGNYGQHYLLHRVPGLWRIHRTHHADPVCDVTTSLRFHPAEALVSEIVDLAIILACGVPPVAVAVYRVARLATSSLAHANFGLGHTAEKLLRLVIITPDLHRIHHSVSEAETNSNFSGGFIWWDRLFGTYCARPRHGQLGMRVGLRAYPPSRANSLRAVLTDPFAAGESYRG